MKIEADKITELLAPAGDYECFAAAVKAGADAVYAGGDRFGARAYAANFSKEELIDAIEYAHLFEKKFYLTVNTILKNDEINSLYDYITPLYEKGLDGVIVQDIGVISTLSKCFPLLSLHASTQMAITGIEGVEFLKELGISRVVPARELSLKELRAIHDNTGMELECFVHGALCYSYSGKCLFSSLVGGRSGNRGRCAQPCRLPYDDSYILSMRDISTLSLLPEMIGSGIVSFKIEGRMKSKEYVAGVTGIYRKYIDLYLKNGKDGYQVEKEDLIELDGLYTRSGHCDGYYHRHNGRSMITIDKPSYNTAGQDALKKLYNKYTAHENKIKIWCEVIAKRGEPLSIKMGSGSYSVTCLGETVENARTNPTLKPDIKKHIDKLGDTCFEFEDLLITNDDNIFVPVSALNRVRREAVSELKEKMLLSFRREPSENKAISLKKPGEVNDFNAPLVDCRIDRLELLDVVLKSDLTDIISIGDIKDPSKLRNAAELIHNSGKQVYYVLPAIIRNGWLNRNNALVNMIKEGIPDGVVTDNYEGLYYLKEAGYSKRIITDLHMYASNDAAVLELMKRGADILTYPVELNARELASLKMEKGEFILYGRLPMMISAQCIQKTKDKCLSDNGISDIRDRYGNVFSCVRNCPECFNTILNCVPNMVTSLDNLPTDIQPYSYRIHFTIEDKSTAEEILRIYSDVLKGKETETLKIKYTLGHLKRGVE